MTQDYKIPRNEPGVAGSHTSSYGNAENPRYGEGVADTIDIPITVGGAAIDFPMYSVLNYNRATQALTKAVILGGVSNANCIAAQPIRAGAGVQLRAVVYVDGHWNSEGLIWDATFTTQQQKEGAFEASRTTILVSTKLFKDSAIDIPN